MVRKIIISIFLLFNFNLAGFAFSEDSLNQMEYIKYGSIFSEEDLSSRLRRLETDSFGMSQSGDLDSRINNLSKVITPKNYGINQYYDNYYMPEKKGLIRRFFDNISNSMATPYVTGYTPSINSNGYSNNLYRNEIMNMRNGSYCPVNPVYPNRNHQRFHNHYYNNYDGNKYNNLSLNNPPVYRQNQPYRYNPYYNPYNHIPTNAFTNVMTGSTVHILND